MKNLRQYGVAVMPLSDVVDDFCLAQGNIRQSGYAAQLRHARWSWKELFWKTLWNIRKAVICVDGKTSTIKLPDDCDIMFNISVVDCYGKLHPLGFNTDFNTTQISCPKPSCSCGCKGEDTLCAVIDSIKAVTETVVIDGKDYTKTTLTRYDGSGAVQTQQTIPAWDLESGKVVFNTLIETVCNVETTGSGCIKSTPANMGILRDRCGCGNFFDEWASRGFSWGGYNPFRQLMPAPYNYWGEYNFNAANPQIVHIFSGAATHFGHTADQETTWRQSIRQVIVEYQTNGETPEVEILVPEYAVEALQIGMVYRQKYLHPRIGENEKIMARNAWTLAQKGVVTHLNPLNMEVVAKLQTNDRKW
jgi:hypothetical protein